MVQLPEWTEFDVDTVTPLFTHAEGGQLTGATVRGQSRHWLRALVGQRFGQDLHALAAFERAVYGSTRQASPVRMRIASAGAPKVVPEDAYVSDLLPRGAGVDTEAAGKWVTYLLGQGLATIKGGQRLSRAAVKPGHRYTVKALLPTGSPRDDAVSRLFLSALWLACSYGGFGARVRRGFGGVALTYRRGPLPQGWDADLLAPPDYAAVSQLGFLPRDNGPLAGALAAMEQLSGFLNEELDKDGQRVFTIDEDRARKTPAYPILGKDHTRANLADSEPAPLATAMAAVGERYRHFRATDRHPTANYQPAVKTPEHIPVIERRSQTVFPLGALGLPVGYGKGAGVNAIDDGKEARRASPLWLRFVGEPGSKNVRLFSFGFLNPLIPEGARVKVELKKGRDRKDLQVTDAHVRSALEAWMRGDESWERPR